MVREGHLSARLAGEVSVPEVPEGALPGRLLRGHLTRLRRASPHACPAQAQWPRLCEVRMHARTPFTATMRSGDDAQWRRCRDGRMNTRRESA
jgi:hypothetical protein